MGLKIHHWITGIFIILIITVLCSFDVQANTSYNPNNWSSMSISLGASILTVVGILTSILASNENNRRLDFIDIQNKISKILDLKLMYSQDSKLSEYYNHSIKTIKELIDDRSPMKYSESYLGFASFFLFVSSVILAIYGSEYEYILGTFLAGLSFIIGYIIYCIEEFRKMDKFATAPSPKGTINTLSVKLNNIEANLLEDIKNNEKVINTSLLINNIELSFKFKGVLKNGFTHVVLMYNSNEETHIPDRNTHLSNIGFIDNHKLAIYGGEDTGILHSDDEIELTFKIPLRNAKGSNLNKFIREVNFPVLGKKRLYEYPSVPNNVLIRYIFLRMYEDPFYRPNYKRREVNLIKIRIDRVIHIPPGRSIQIKRQPLPAIGKLKELFVDFFDDYTDAISEPWIQVIENMGEVSITNEIEGVLNTEKSMKIHHPVGSQAYVRRTFNASQKVFIRYYIRQENYDERGLGSPFIVESPSRVRLNGISDNRPVFMDILNRKIRCGGNPRNPREICEILLNKWYLISLEIDCINHIFKCTVNDHIIEGEINEAYDNVSAIRTKYWGKNSEWTTYIGGVEVYKLD